MGLLGCGSGRTVTVRILELMTAGGLQRHAQSNTEECYLWGELYCTFKIGLNCLSSNTTTKVEYADKLLSFAVCHTR